MSNRNIPFFKILDSQYPAFPPSLAKVADYLRSHYKEAVFLSLAQTASGAGVSEASVLRFARALGYDGYSELQSILQSYVSDSMLTTVERFRSLNREQDSVFPLTGLVEKSLESLKSLSQLVSVKDLKSFASSLTTYTRILIVGFESTAGLAEYLCYYLQRAGRPAWAITEKTGSLFSTIQESGRKTLVIALLVARYPKAAIDFCRSCTARGAVLSVVSDTSDHPLFDSVSRQFSVALRRSDGMNLENHIAMLSFLQVLILECGLGDRGRTNEALKALEEHNRDFHIFS